MRVVIAKTALKNENTIRDRLSRYMPDFGAGPIRYSEDEIFNLMLSAIRAYEWGIVSIVRSGSRERYNVDIQQVQQWIEEKVIPNTIAIKADEIDLLKLMVFSLAMPYKMLRGETRATTSEKVQIRDERYFGRIFSDTFVGKIGEIAFKKFVVQQFGENISLDWDIGTDIDTFKSDIVGSKGIISIKSTDTLESIWAEAPTKADYGIFVKVGLPKDFFMKILAHISSLKKLLEFVEERLDEKDSILSLVKFIEQTAYEEEMSIKGYVCGFFQTSTGTLKQKGQDLPYLGEVHEDKHLTECSNLKYSHAEWEQLFSTVIT